MTGLTGSKRMHHKPVPVPPAAFDPLTEGIDPAAHNEAAHTTAALLVSQGRSAADPKVLERLISLAQEVGIAEIAELWAHSTAVSLPGALWRLYALHTWTTQRSDEVVRFFRAGKPYADVSHVIAGVADPPGVEEVRNATASILYGVFAGDLAVALERAAAFCTVLAEGSARLSQHAAEEPLAWSNLPYVQLANRDRSLRQTGEDLAMAARAWRRNELL